MQVIVQSEHFNWTKINEQSIYIYIAKYINIEYSKVK